MANFVKIEDFVGRYKLPFDKYTKADLQAYIDEFEKKILVDLLGTELYKAFILDYTSETAGEFSQDRFKDIFKEILEDVYCNVICSQGIPKMLTQMIYFEVYRDMNVKATIGGPQKNEQENSTEAMYVESNIYEVLNSGVENYQNIQYFICHNKNGYDYDLFNGKKKEKSTFV